DSGASSAPSSIHDAKRDEGICIRRVCGRAALHAWKSSGRNDSLRESFCTHNVNDEQAARLKPCPPNQSEILALHQLRAQFMTRSGMKGFVSGRVCGRAALHAWKSSGRNDSLRESFRTHYVNGDQPARLKPSPPNQK